MSLTIPIPSWMTVIARPIRSATSVGPRARIATAPLPSPSSPDGNGWVRRIQPSARSPTVGGGSDVNGLPQIPADIPDEPIAAIGHLGSDARDEREQGDRGDH